MFRNRAVLLFMVVVPSVFLLVGCEDSSFPPGGGEDGVTTVAVLVPWIPQQTDVWCWAATTAMVLNYYGVPITQCEIVSNAMALPCCSLPISQCRTTGPIDVMMGALQVHANLAPYWLNGPLALNNVKNEIDRGRPMIAAYQGSFSGHVVVIYGYDSQNNLLIHDPIYGSVRVPYGASFVYSGNLIWFGTILMSR